MLEKLRLERLCFILVVIGIVGLFVFTAFQEPRAIRIEQINLGMAGESVVVNASVKNIVEKDGNFFIALQDGNASIKAVVFSKDVGVSGVANIRKSERVAVIGKVDNYYGAVEIVISRIVKID
jgi:aspartyl/asparaginyl-tRNA synthetase